MVGLHKKPNARFVYGTGGGWCQGGRGTEALPFHSILAVRDSPRRPSRNSGQVLILVAGPETSAALPLPAPPKTVEPNPDGAVLARVRKK